MSMRSTKRVTGGRSEEQPGPSGSAPGPTSAASTSKRRRAEPDHDAHWHIRQDLKMSSIYNRSASEAPAELFRKDLISAMKLPDNEPLTPSEYWIITDPWKQDWERGVQVPVNPDYLPAPKVKIIDNPRPPDHTAFKLPKDKYIHLTRDSNYQSEKHQLSSTPACAEAACSYDLDATDTTWLKLLNAERARAGAAPITEEQLEKVIEELEVRTWDKIQAIIKSEEGLGIEYDENVICDVCRSPDSEDGNEMVFCDSCNICVHQACYGITVIPDGQWLCRPCGDKAKPTCVLCPNLGGAMKCTPSGHKWAHVSCVLWIPEVSIGCAEKMEPITKISSIPTSRWSLVCVLCRERKGACIQCSVKSCKTAYHVTCAFKHGLEMRAIIEDEIAEDGVKLRSYCQKHSVNSKKEKCPGSGSEEEEVKKKRRKDMTSEEKTQARAARLHEIEKEFDKHVSVKDISSHLLDVDQDAINYIYHYWKLKRRSSRNRPLLPPKSDDSDLMSHRQEQADLEKMKMFVQLRQDLERVRNLCYMVSRREKLSRSFFRQREQTFHKQVAVLSAGVEIPKEEMDAIIEANHGPSIYDRLYSHPNATDHKSDFEALLSKIAPHRADSGDDKNKDRNGLARRSKANPYKKHYVNGTRRSGSRISGISSEESESEIARGKYRSRSLGSSTDDDRDTKKKNSTSPKKKVSPKTKSKIQKSPKKITDKKKKKVPQSKAMVESSTEDDTPARGASKKDKSISTPKSSRRDKSISTPRSSRRDKSISTPRSSRRDKSASSLLREVKKEPVPSTSGVSKREKDPSTSKRDRLPSTSGSAKKDRNSIHEGSGIKKEKDVSTNAIGTIKKEKDLSTNAIGTIKKEKETSSTSSLKKEKEPVPSTSKKDQLASKTLRQMEKEMAAGRLGISGSDSDDLDLVPIRTTKNVKFPVDIYSSSSDDSSNAKKLPENNKTKIDKSNKVKVTSSPSGNDSQQSFRTKAAMKEFVHAEKKDKYEENKPAPKKRGRKPSNKDVKPPVPVKTSISDNEALSKESKQSKPKDLPGIVPQRQAAKKASENMRSTTSGKKEETAAPERPVEDPKGKGKGKGKSNELRSPPAKVAKKASKDGNDTISIVPQRQAAKKAAAHIKSIGSKGPAPETTDNTVINAKKIEDRIEPAPSDDKNISMSNDSSSSSSCSSSSSSSESSSDDETPAPGPKPAVKAREIKPLSRPPSVFSPPGSRPVLDLPFLDKVSRPLSSTSASSDTESLHSDRSGSTSPTPKRPRRRRKGKSISNDVSPRKAPDKKLKTSELESECRVPSAAAQGEEPGGADACASTSARSRSATASGDIPDHHVAGPREPPADAAAVQVAAESREPRQLSPQKWKTNKEAMNIATTGIHAGDDAPLPPNDPQVNTEPIDPMKSDNVQIKIEPDSPRSISESKNIFSNVDLGLLESEAKEPERQDSNSLLTEEKPRVSVMETPQNLYDSQKRMTTRASISPKKPVDPSTLDNSLQQVETEEKKTTAGRNEHYNDNNKQWLAKSPNLPVVPPQIERPGDSDKYMTDDKTFETECTEKSSIKMIAKIQANLNENTMIKSPRTPMDARSINMDAIESENTSVKNIKKRSPIDNAQDASQMQGVEISKSAKIPSTVNPYPNRSMFSPQQKDNELFAFDMMAVDDGFNHDDDLIKPFSSYPEFFFKEDSKEQGVQETLNLVDRLRMQLINKKPLTENSSQEQAVATSDQNDNREEEQMRDSELNRVTENAESEQAKSVVSLEAHNHVHPEPPSQQSLSHIVQTLDMPHTLHMLENEYHHPQPIPVTSNKWTPMSMAHNDPYMEQEQTYEHNDRYMDENKDSTTAQCDTNTLKQNDDSCSVMKVDNATPTTFDAEATQDAHTFDNNNSVMHADSPYMTEEKWHESKIASRRSSASSSSSDGVAAAAAAEHDRNMLAAHLELRDAMLLVSALPPGAGPMMPEIDSYPPPAYSCSVEPAMPLNQYATYPPNASPFLSRMGSLFGPGACSQLPMPSPSPLFGTGMAFAPPPLLARQLCAAAFTSSSQNIALTTQMIAPPTPKPHYSPANDSENTEDKFPIRVASSSPSVSVGSYENISTAKLPDDISEAMTPVSQAEFSESSQKSETKSSPRAPKIALKFSGKSPGKSPGISPRQGEAPLRSKRATNKNARSSRGRGRSKSRNHTPAVDYMGNSIQSKLVGTVYDFEEEIANDSVDLKALRDRSKSVDVRDDRRSEHLAKDASRSPQLSSPQYKRTEVGERGAAGEPELGGFPQVSLLLPGPVDMRTYQPLEPPAPAPAAPPPFAAPAEPEPPPSALPPAPPNPAPPPPHLYVPQLPKVSLSDSRNQLKVKIKGPFLDANYSSSTPTVVAPPPAPALDTPPSALNSVVVANASAMAAGGSTNLRRMRKKELLRQYWTQDMNMDDPTGASMMGVVLPPAQPSPLTRAVITIPKAVASMTSIPTREDYKITDTPVETQKKQKRKVSSGLSRELRHLQVTMNDDLDTSEDLKLSSYVATTPPQSKKRARLFGKQGKSGDSPPLAPKLKIKLGSNTVQQVSEELRPPKKRLAPKPSFEDLRRESMKYRKMVMADFEENEKAHKHKQTKSEKRKKKKDKKMKIINSDGENDTKLVIKIKLPVAPGEESTPARAAVAAAPEPVVDPIDHYDPSMIDPLAFDAPSYTETASAMRKVRTAKVTPIRLKLARSTQGTSYVMKGEETPPLAPEPAPPAAPEPALDKHSDVR